MSSQMTPRWVAGLWALGASDLIVQAPGYCEDFPRWRLLFWRLRGPILQKLFGWWWWSE